jgi:hypothetical protein
LEANGVRQSLLESVKELRKLEGQLGEGALRKSISLVLAAVERKGPPEWMSVNGGAAWIECSSDKHDSLHVNRFEELLSVYTRKQILLDTPRVEMLRDLCDAYLDGRLSSFLEEVEGGVW